MRLGGPVFTNSNDPDAWIKAVQSWGYRAAYCPVEPDAPTDTIQAFARAAHDADIVIAEVGAWSNPLSRDESVCRQALQKCEQSLALADEIGARCCVNIAGSLGDRWDGPYAEDLSADAFDRIVAAVREIIDTVQPIHTFYTVEPMPWMYPDSPDSYLELISAVDRRAFAVHLDPVNMINSPGLYFHNGDFLKECFEKLGPYIKSCHAKDVLLQEKLTTHLDEVRPGLGQLNYRVFLRQAHHLDPDLPVMVEHLSTADEYQMAVEYIRLAAKSEDIPL